MFTKWRTEAETFSTSITDFEMYFPKPVILLAILDQGDRASEDVVVVMELGRRRMQGETEGRREQRAAARGIMGGLMIRSQSRI